MGRTSERQEGRWRARPVAGALVRAAAFLVPAGAGVGMAVLVASRLPRPDPGAPRMLWWLVVLGCSTVTVWITERLGRRLLPLAGLLKLTLAFPDRAPSRYVLARTAGNTRLLERRVREARRRGGVDDDPTRAAEMVLTLVAAIGVHDRRTRGHSERVRAFVDMLAEEMDLAPEARVHLRWAALLHDLGKLQVEAEILNKPGKLEDDEWEAIRAHPEAGARLAGPLLPWLGEWGRAITEHHERFDGTGYPYGMPGERISLAGRITAIADAFETMTAPRSYKKPLSVTAARQELVRCAHVQFDPDLVRAFLNISLGRLVWTVGPMAWLAQVPLLQRLATVGDGPLAVASSAARIRTLAGIVAIGMSGAVLSPPEEAAGPQPAEASPGVVREMADPSAARPWEAAVARDESRDRDARDAPGSRSTGSKDTSGTDEGTGGSPAPAPEPSDPDPSGGLVPTVVGDVEDAVGDAVEEVQGIVDPVIDDISATVEEVTDPILDL